LPRVSSSSESGKTKWPQLYLGVAFTTLATLLLELSLTRIFSVVFYYHFAFLAISIALFGLGAGGLFSYVVAGRGGNIFYKLGVLAVVNSIAVVASLVFILTRTGELGNFTLAGVYFASALPFFFSGTVVSIAVAEAIQRVDRVYFFDLIGAAGGCLLLVPFLNYFGGPNTVIAASVLLAVSAAIWYNLAGTLRGRAGAVTLALMFVALMAFNGTSHLIDIRYAKGHRIGREAFVRWNPISRIALLNPKTSDPEIVIDADASTGIPTFDLQHLTEQQRANLLHEGPGFPYMLRPGAKTLVIGPGGGWDVARALTGGSKDVTAVEINPIIAHTIMQQRFADLSRRLYFRPEVHLFVEDGRSFVRRSPEKYQVLQATLVDTWASTAAGAFALSENNLYTTDAFRDYLNHLTDDGLMVFTRWGFQPPRESLRLLSLAIEALGQIGETDARRHVVVLRDRAQNIDAFGALDTVLIFRKPLDDAGVARVKSALSQTSLRPLYIPGDAPSNEFGELMTSADPKAFWRNYRYNVTPVDDDRPFFFYTVQPRDVLNFIKQGGLSADYKINRALPLLFEVLGISVLAIVVVLAFPPLLLGARLPAERGVRGFLLYFVCIGAGYILIQVALIQKFVLFLGHPTYALTVIIFSMLISSGLGSYWSRRLTGESPDTGAATGKLSAVLIGVAATVSTLAYLAAPVSEFGVGWPLPLKALVTVCMIAPAGFLMGIPFPTGLTRLQKSFPQAVRWAWALNAAASVLGSVAAICLAIYIGLRATVLTGALLYLCALSVVWLQKRPAPATVLAEAEVRL
jgi:hypothetical protein